MKTGPAKKYANYEVVTGFFQPQQPDAWLPSKEHHDSEDTADDADVKQVLCKLTAARYTAFYMRKPYETNTTGDKGSPSPEFAFVAMSRRQRAISVREVALPDRLSQLDRRYQRHNGHH